MQSTGHVRRCDLVKYCLLWDTIHQGGHYRYVLSHVDLLKLQRIELENRRTSNSP